MASKTGRIGVRNILLSVMLFLGMVGAAAAQVGIDSPLGGVYTDGQGPEPYYSHPHRDTYDEGAMRPSRHHRYLRRTPPVSPYDRDEDGE